MPRQNVEGHNFIEGPICMAPERLYWHKIEGEIIPCPDKPTCSHCKDKQERLNHPTQTPLYVWEWILQRFTKPGMRVYDPYAGLRTLEMANRRGGFGLEIISSEINPDYVRVGEMWQDGTWLVPQAGEYKQMAIGE